MKTISVALMCIACLLPVPGPASAQDSNAYRVLATSKTSTMQKEMQEAGAAGYRYAAVMGGETAVGGKEVVAVMQRTGQDTSQYEYRLLATNRTSTMQKEMQEAADVGFRYAGQTVFESLLGGKEVVVILERTPGAADAPKFEYRLIATTKTSTLEKEMKEAGGASYEVVGMTVGKTLVGGTELVAITRRPVK